MKKIVLSSLVGLVLFSSCATAVDYKTRYVKWIYHFPQERQWWCSYASSQMWIRHLTGKKIPQWKIGVYNKWKGMNGTRYMKTMRHYTGKRFQFRMYTSIYQTKKRIYEELVKQGRPLELGGTTIKYLGKNRHSNDLLKYTVGQHSILIWAAKIKPKKGHYWIDYVKILDSVYNSRFSVKRGGEYVGVSPDKKVHYNELYYHRWRPHPNTETRFTTDD